MKNKFTTTRVLVAIATCLALTSSCQKEAMPTLNNDPAGQPTSGERSMYNGRATAEIKLGSSHINSLFMSVKLEIKRLAVHYTDHAIGFDGWLYFPIRVQVTDIMKYQDGLSAILGSDQHLIPGMIDQVRVEFGDNSSAMWIDSGKREIALSMGALDHVGSAPLNLRITETTRVAIGLDINMVQSLLVLEGGRIVQFHPHLRVTSIIPMGENGGHVEISLPDTK